MTEIAILEAIDSDSHGNAVAGRQPTWKGMTKVHLSDMKGSSSGWTCIISPVWQGWKRTHSRILALHHERVWLNNLPLVFILVNFMTIFFLVSKSLKGFNSKESWTFSGKFLLLHAPQFPSPNKSRSVCSYSWLEIDFMARCWWQMRYQKVKKRQGSSFGRRDLCTASFMKVWRVVFWDTLSIPASEAKVLSFKITCQRTVAVRKPENDRFCNWNPPVCVSVFPQQAISSMCVLSPSVSKPPGQDLGAEQVDAHTSLSARRQKAQK